MLSFNKEDQCFHSGWPEVEPEKLLSFIVGVKMEGLCHRLASRCVEKFCSVFRAVMSLSTVHNSCCQVNLVLSQCSSLAVVIQR